MQVNDTDLLKIQNLTEDALESLADYGDVRQCIRYLVKLQTAIIDLRESIGTPRKDKGSDNAVSR